MSARVQPCGTQCRPCKLFVITGTSLCQTAIVALSSSPGDGLFLDGGTALVANLMGGSQGCNHPGPRSGEAAPSPSSLFGGGFFCGRCFCSSLQWFLLLLRQCSKGILGGHNGLPRHSSSAGGSSIPPVNFSSIRWGGSARFSALTGVSSRPKPHHPLIERQGAFVTGTFCRLFCGLYRWRLCWGWSLSLHIIASTHTLRSAQ